jgi:PTS system cellobiose-specific IIB component
MGMSSSLLATKTIEVAQEKGVNLDLKLLSGAEAAVYNFRERPVDLVLVAPQVRFRKRSIEKAASPYGIPVELIDTVTFGMVDGEKLFEQIVQAVKDKTA